MTGHKSVLLAEVVAALEPKPGKHIVDGTLGGGGHTYALLEKGAKVIGIDKDAAQLERTKEFLKSQNVVYIHDDFKNIKEILKTVNLENLKISNNIDGVLLDLGVSSFQLDEPERGFSYARPAPLDMRMDNTNPFSAEEVVNRYSEEGLVKILFEYGEEKFARRIAAKIIAARPIRSTTQLAEIVKNAIPAPARRTGGNPAKRTFQAIRIEVNGELEGLSQAVSDFIEMLAPGGVLAVISFHSLEDRAVKIAMKTAEKPCTCPSDFPMCVCGKKSLGKCSKLIIPSETEILDNPRAAGAKLRVFRKN